MGNSEEHEQAAVADTLVRYALYSDTLQIEKFAALYTEDAVWEGMGTRYERAAGINKFAQSLLTVAIGVRHHVSNFRIKISGTSATAHSYVLAVNVKTQPPTILLSGEYDDELVRAASGEWKIKRRRFTSAGSV